MNPLAALIPGIAGSPEPGAPGSRTANPSEAGLFAHLLDIAANASLTGTEGLPADPASDAGLVGPSDPEAALEPVSRPGALTPGVPEGEIVALKSAGPVDIEIAGEAEITAALPAASVLAEPPALLPADGLTPGLGRERTALPGPNGLPAPAAFAEGKLTGLQNAVAHAGDGPGTKGLDIALVRAGGPQGQPAPGPAPETDADPAALARPANAPANRHPATPATPAPQQPVGRLADAAAAQAPAGSPAAPSAAEAIATRAAPSRPQPQHAPVRPAKLTYDPATGQVLLKFHKRTDGDLKGPSGPDNGLATVSVRAPGAPPQSALPQPALPGQPPQVPLNGLAVHIAQQAQNGAKRFDIRLDPPELGRVEIRLDVTREGHVTTHLVVERSETLDLLQRDARALERALQNAGLDTSEGGLKFSLKDHGQPHDRPGNHDETGGRAAQPPEAVSGELPADEAVLAHSSRQYLVTGGLDIRI